MALASITRLGRHEALDEFTNAVGGCLFIATLQVRNNSLKSHQGFLTLSEVILIAETDLVLACPIQDGLHVLFAQILNWHILRNTVMLTHGLQELRIIRGCSASPCLKRAILNALRWVWGE
ncbi:hypothetical protein D1872_256420 [compost metagenome]